MIDPQRLSDPVTELEQLLRDRLGTRGRSLGVKLRRAGRRLPRYARNAGRRITSAQTKLAHPKLARLVDQAALDRDMTVLRDTLKDIDPKERRKDAVLSVLGSVVLNLILLGAVILAFLWWRGAI